MLKKNLYDVIFIILLAVVLSLVYKFNLDQWLSKFLYVPFLAVYFVGKWVSRVEIKRKKSSNFL